MKKIQALLIPLLISLHGFSQEHAINKVTTIDSSLIGKKVKHAVRELGLDTNWMAVHEPPGVLRGIHANLYNVDVRICIERHMYLERNVRKARRHLLNQRITGVAWLTETDCNAVGASIPQYAYDKFGPCGKEEEE